MELDISTPIACLPVITTFLDIFNAEIENDLIAAQQNFVSEISAIAYLTDMMRRDYVPRITGYTEHVVPQFTLDDFRFHFRIQKTMFEQIARIVSPYLLRTTGGGLENTDPVKQLLLFLWYMANQQSIRELSHQFGIGMSTVHGTIRKVNWALNTKLANVIQWPGVAIQQEIAREFQLKSGIPGIIGALDGTHIRLSACPNGDADYINRKSFPSMQLQVVVDNSLIIRDVYTGWPGCTHDARVLRNSSLFTNAEDGSYFSHGTFLIGDSAYPLKPWLITPFKDNGRLTAEQRRFNRTLSAARQVVERSIGHLKGRFRRLKDVTVHSPGDIVRTIVSGCILHNLCVLCDDNIEEFIEVDNDIHPNQYQNIFANAQAGIDKRNMILQGLP